MRALLTAQFPDLANLSLVKVDEGFDNVTYRLGDDLALRIPRRNMAAQLIENEQKWLAQLGPRLPLAIPAALYKGVPGCGYPWSWSVVPWFEGETVDKVPLRAGEAERLGAFLKALHGPAPEDAPDNPFRGCSLLDRKAPVEQRMDGLEQETDAITPAIWDIWTTALATPVDVPPTWLHGDLHARNVLGKTGALSAIIDWGDITSGDRACDLASFWMLIEERQERALGLAAYGGMSEATIARARGWAVSFGVFLFSTGLVDHAAHAKMGADILRRLTEEGAGT